MDPSCSKLNRTSIFCHFNKFIILHTDEYKTAFEAKFCMKEKITNAIIGKLIAETSLLVGNADENFSVFNLVVSNTRKNFCVGIVDMVNSTKITTKLPQNKMILYYEIFLNSMADIINKFRGAVIKSVGDSLLFYFPEPCHTKKDYGSLNCLECVFAMVEEYEQINEKLQKECLPSVDYRISVDYGLISLMKSTNSIDIIGKPVNMCAKINRQAAVNGIILGGDLYQMVKDFAGCYFKEADGFSIGLPQTYPIYSARRKHVS